MKSLFKKTKTGASSIYIVTFTCIIFGIVTLSFIRIMLSEAGQSSNDDLSQSAYDSAIAGVEDAKIAVHDYYMCLSQGRGSNCRSPFARNVSENDINCQQDFVIGSIVHGAQVGEAIKIEEIGNNNSDSGQSYTCVIVRDVVPDYRGTLSSDTRVRVVPLGLNRGSGTSAVTSSLSQVKKIKFHWYSTINQGTQQFRNLNNGGQLENYDKAPTPPTISLTLIKVPQSIDINTLSQENNIPNSVIYSTVVLLPSDNGVQDRTISASTLRQAGTVESGGNSTNNEAFTVKCVSSTEFACNVTLETDFFSNGDNAMLVVSLPYGDVMTDFAVGLVNGANEAVDFKGLQLSVDSTGRTGQLFRRVEARLDPADLFFTYPQYELELGGQGGSGDLIKNFWVTANCWFQQPTIGGTCSNNVPLH